MKRAPKLWRRKKAGKSVGNWFVTVRGVDVNLGSKDAARALGRRPAALAGTRNFEDDAEGAAADVADALAPPPPPIQPAVPPPPDVPPPPAPPPPAPEPEADAPKPDGWADAVDAAADEDADDAPSDAAAQAAAAPAAFHVTIEDIAKVLGLPADKLAPIAVELQLKGHEMIGDLAGYDLPAVAADHPGRALLATGYVPVIRMLQAEDLKIHPGWFILAGSVLIIASQARGATKRTDKPKASAGAAA